MKDAVLTVRLPGSVRKRIEKLAHAEGRMILATARTAGARLLGADEVFDGYRVERICD